MPWTCTIERHHDHLVLEVWNKDGWWLRSMDALDPESAIGGDWDAPISVAIDLVEDAEFVALEFPPGIPDGYCVYTFYRGRGASREVVKSVLCGPGGIKVFANPRDAVNFAVAESKSHAHSASTSDGWRGPRG